ncbi:MAG: MerR family transcriptional regulator [Piscinibacter sp.]|nr:MerR family transcriptional regulator [Piscinibacter sp.]
MDSSEQPPHPAPPRLSIAEVERASGLSKDTLRAWERRYGFPVPSRDDAGNRLYGADDLEKLRLMKHLIECGARPGRLVHRSQPELLAMLDPPETPTARAPAVSATEKVLELIGSHDVDGLRRSLRDSRARLGAARFVAEVVAPLNTRVGEGWMRGQVQVFEEHLYTESVQVVLRETISALPPVPAAARPRVLLTTFPGEPHGLGLLMAEALLALEGARCLSLGVATPLWDIVLASRAQDSDIVALSFSGCMNPNQVIDALTELRARLPRGVALWAGGAAPVLHRRPVADVTAIATLSQIGAELQRWRKSSTRP